MQSFYYSCKKTLLLITYSYCNYLCSLWSLITCWTVYVYSNIASSSELLNAKLVSGLFFLL